MSKALEKRLRALEERRSGVPKGNLGVVVIEEADEGDDDGQIEALIAHGHA